MRNFLNLMAYSLLALGIVIGGVLASHYEGKGDMGYFFSHGAEVYYIGKIGTIEVTR